MLASPRMSVPIVKRIARQSEEEKEEEEGGGGGRQPPERILLGLPNGKSQRESVRSRDEREERKKERGKRKRSKKKGRKLVDVDRYSNDVFHTHQRSLIHASV